MEMVGEHERVVGYLGNLRFLGFLRFRVIDKFDKTATLLYTCLDLHQSLNLKILTIPQKRDLDKFQTFILHG